MVRTVYLSIVFIIGLCLPVKAAGNTANLGLNFWTIGETNYVETYNANLAILDEFFVTSVTAISSTTFAILENDTNTSTDTLRFDINALNVTTAAFHVVSIDCLGIVTPTSVGQTCFDTVLQAFFVATGTVLGEFIPTGGDFTPVCGIMPWGSALPPPSGWLIADGDSYLISEFPDLFACLSTSWGNGSTDKDGAASGGQFNVPDFRGRFVRGQDEGTGRDTDVGSRTAIKPGGSTGDNVGSLQGDATRDPGFAIVSAGDHNHSVNTGGGGHQISGGGNGITAGGNITGNSGAHGHTFSGGDSETRPKNVVTRFIIKAANVAGIGGGGGSGSGGNRWSLGLSTGIFRNSPVGIEAQPENNVNLRVGTNTLRVTDSGLFITTVPFSGVDFAVGVTAFKVLPSGDVVIGHNDPSLPPASNLLVASGGLNVGGVTQGESKLSISNSSAPGAKYSFFKENVTGNLVLENDDGTVQIIIIDTPTYHIGLSTTPGGFARLHVNGSVLLTRTDSEIDNPLIGFIDLLGTGSGWTLGHAGSEFQLANIQTENIDPLIFLKVTTPAYDTGIGLIPSTFAASGFVHFPSGAVFVTSVTVDTLFIGTTNFEVFSADLTASTDTLANQLVQVAVDTTTLGDQLLTVAVDTTTLGDQLLTVAVDTTTISILLPNTTFSIFVLTKDVASTVDIEIATSQFTMNGNGILSVVATVHLENVSGGASKVYTITAKEDGTPFGHPWEITLSNNDDVTHTFTFYQSSTTAASHVYTLSIRSNSIAAGQNVIASNLLVREN